MDTFIDRIQKEVRKKRVLVTIAAVCLVASTFLSGCYQAHKGVDDALHALSEGTVTKINVFTLPLQPGILSGLEITDREDIQAIVNYLGDIETTRTKENPGVYAAMSYVLEFQLDDSRDIRVSLFGNKFILAANHAKEVTYDDAEAFDSVLGSIVVNQYRNGKAGNPLVGMVTSVFSHEREDESREWFCTLDTVDERVGISSAYVFDTTTNEGRTFPRRGDRVEVYLRGDAGGSTMIAEVVLIIS